MIIETKKWSDLPFSIIAWGGIGYVLGKIEGVNEKLSATVLATHSLAKHLFFHFTSHVVPYTSLKFSSKAIETASDAIVSVATIIVAQQLALISLKTAGLFGALTAGIFFANVRRIHTQTI
jgi:hypothetical protein